MSQVLAFGSRYRLIKVLHFIVIVKMVKHWYTDLLWSYFRPKSNVTSFFFHFILQADIDNSGTIDYGEFIAATLHLNKVEREDHLYAAFQYFDKDGSGYITADELQQACDEFGIEDVRLEDMIGEVDQDNVRSHNLNDQQYTCNFINHDYIYDNRISFNHAC